MQIKTITCHEVYNHGASLQEYALLEFLISHGFSAETIHYKPPYLSGHFNLSAISNPKYNTTVIKQLYLLAKLPGRLIALKRKKAFDDFHRKYIPTGTVLYRNNQELRQNPPIADAFICGSDQIWNSFFENGKDPAFYLNFAPDTVKKISYAPSFAIDRLDEAVKPLVKENVSRLNAISVRETSGLKILQELGIRNAVQVLDPVFLLASSHWKNKFVKDIDEKFVFVYDFDNNSIIQDIALQLKVNNGFRIFTVNQQIEYADRNFFLEGPEKFLSLIHSAQYIISNSFHAVAFSLIFEKQFAVVNRKESINTRMRDLLNLFDLGDRLISSVIDFNSLAEIDHSLFLKKKQMKIQYSKDFLLSALNS